MMLLALDRIEHFLDQIINEQHLQLNARIIHGNRQIIRDVVAECTDSRIIIRAHPLADQIREAVHHDAVAGFLAIRKEQFLSGFLA